VTSDDARRPAAKHVAALVLTWNSADLIERCLESLAAAVPAQHVMVVDNASADGTAQLVRDRFPDVEVLETGDNLGFAGGCNAGISALLGDGYEHVFLLNPDAYVATDCIELLAQHLASDERCAAVSPLIHDHPGATVWFAGSDIDWTTGSTYHRGQGGTAEMFGTDPIDTDRINGGAVLLRATALQEVGLFDEGYFLYYEETDLSVRLTRAGWGLHVLPTARAWHEASSSTGGNLGRVYNYYLTRGRLSFLRKRAEGRVEWTKVGLHLVRETRWLTKTFGLRATAPAVLARLLAVLDFARHREGRVSI
jgi:N-acetylglucosaminyl-diphospho-decaprenol L-rhamnosyltransferase